MEMKSLILGMVFSMGIFAVKSGVGLHYFAVRTRHLKSTVVVLLSWSGGYLLLFWLMFAVLRQFDFLQHIEMVQDLVTSGMFVHTAMAILMGVYGLILLQKTHVPKKSRLWMLLVFPCPLCLMVILLSLGFLLSYFPDIRWEILSAVWAGFVGIALATLLIMKTVVAGKRSMPESLLGAAMLFIAAYFVLSVMLMPQFGDIDKIYRLATYQGDHTKTSLTQIAGMILILAVFFMMGFASGKKTMRRERY
jgi:predicted transporter